MTSQTATEAQRLSELLPTTIGPSSPADAPTTSGVWSADELARSRAATTQRRLEDGWQLGKTPGVLTKGEGRAKVEMRVTEIMPSLTGAKGFNASRDAFALRLGSDLEGPNRYRFGPLLLDANGACRDEGECPECGSTQMRYDSAGQVVAGGEYRFTVPDGEGGWTYCRLCVDEREMSQIRQRAEAQRAAREARGARR